MSASHGLRPNKTVADPAAGVVRIRRVRLVLYASRVALPQLAPLERHTLRPNEWREQRHHGVYGDDAGEEGVEKSSAQRRVRGEVAREVGESSLVRVTVREALLAREQGAAAAHLHRGSKTVTCQAICGSLQVYSGNRPVDFGTGFRAKEND